MTAELRTPDPRENYTPADFVWENAYYAGCDIRQMREQIAKCEDPVALSVAIDEIKKTNALSGLALQEARERVTTLQSSTKAAA